MSSGVSCSVRARRSRPPEHDDVAQAVLSVDADTTRLVTVLLRRQAVRQNGHFLEARRVQLKWQAGVSTEAAALGLGSGFEEEEVASPEGSKGLLIRDEAVPVGVCSCSPSQGAHLPPDPYSAL